MEILLLNNRHDGKTFRMHEMSNRIKGEHNLAAKLHVEDASLADALPRRRHEHTEFHGELGPPPELLDLERRRSGRWRLPGLTGGGGRLLLLLGGPRGGLQGADRYTKRRR